MTGLDNMLERLGLSQYLQPFVDEGFDTWETLMDITESDLEALQVKLGHRRKLQRAIIEARGKTRDNITLGAPQHLGPREESYWSEEESATSVKDQKKPTSSNTGNSGGQKRKYRRHPRQDESAPQRPISAYVVYSNQMRDQLKGQDLSFTEIAKLVGERWQALSLHEKEPCERQAQAMKEKYYAELAEYKRTPQYAQYQKYLADFKAKHSQQDNKRPKSENDEHGVLRKNSLDRQSYNQCPSSPGNTYDPSTHDVPHSPSPATQNRSPKANGKSPSSASPPVPNIQKFPSGPASEDSTSASQDRKAQATSTQSLSARPPGRHGFSYDSSSSTTAYGFPSLSEPAYSPSRPMLGSRTSLPSLKGEETTTSATSSESSMGLSQWTNQIYSLPNIDHSKANTNRVLPPPSALAGSLDPLMNSRPLESSSSASHRTSMNRSNLLDRQDRHPKSSIANLLRAGELIDRNEQRTSRGRAWERE